MSDIQVSDDKAKTVCLVKVACYKIFQNTKIKNELLLQYYLLVYS